MTTPQAEPEAETDLVAELANLTPFNAEDQKVLDRAADEIGRLRQLRREGTDYAISLQRRAEMAEAALRELLACLDPTPREGRHDWLGHYDADECVFCDRGETGEHKANCPMKVAEAALAQEGGE